MTNPSETTRVHLYIRRSLRLLRAKTASGALRTSQWLGEGNSGSNVTGFLKPHGVDVEVLLTLALTHAESPSPSFLHHWSFPALSSTWRRAWCGRSGCRAVQKDARQKTHICLKSQCSNMNGRMYTSMSGHIGPSCSSRAARQSPLLRPTCLKFYFFSTFCSFPLLS